MKPIAHLAPTDNRMIDLTSSLKLPHGSLTPGTDPKPRWESHRRLSHEEHRVAVQDGDDFTDRAALIFAGFLILFIAAIVGYAYAC